MKTADAVRALAPCPTCGVPIKVYCRTATGRNHPARVHDAIAEAIKPGLSAELRDRITEVAHGRSAHPARHARPRR